MHDAYSIADCNIHEITHMKRVIEVRAVGGVGVAAIQVNRSWIMMTLRRAARLAGGGLMDMNRMFAIRQAFDEQGDFHLLDAFFRKTFFQFPSALNIGIRTTYDFSLGPFDSFARYFLGICL